MGGMGTDVAREASALMLLDDNFASVVAAIRAGRRIYDNLEKAMSFIIAVHIPIIGLTLIPAFFSSLPLLLFPLHIVFLELIIDSACSLAFEYEKEESGIMKRPPRRPDDQFLEVARFCLGPCKDYCSLVWFSVFICYLIMKAIRKLKCGPSLSRR